MYVGVGGGARERPLAQSARFRRNDSVRTGARRTVRTDRSPTRAGHARATRRFGYCDPQCSYDNYVYVPPGADADTVYLSGDNEYNENNYGPVAPAARTAAACCSRRTRACTSRT